MWTTYCLLLCAWQLNGQVSKPIATNDQVDVRSSKYLQRVAEDDVDNAERCVHQCAVQMPLVPLACNNGKIRAVTMWAACRHAQDEAAPQGQCGTDIALKWMTEVSSSVYATPIIHDLFSDGHKDIIVPSFVHYLEV